MKLPLIERIDAKRASLMMLGACISAGGAIWAQPAAAPAPLAPAQATALPADKLIPSTAPVSPTPADPSVAPLRAGAIPPSAPAGVPGGGFTIESAPALPPVAGNPTVLPAPGPPPPPPGGMPITRPLPPSYAPPSATGRTPLAPATAYSGTPGASNDSQLSRAIIEEETNPDPSIAKESYKALVQQFDQQRQSAAQAIFRLGECYRRLGRMEEARAQYGRIVREFVDFPDLAQQSMRMLSETARQMGSSGTGARTIGGTPDVPQNVSKPGASNVYSKKLLEMKALVQDQIQVREQALKRAREQLKAGIAPASEVEEAELRLLELKERLLDLNSAEDISSTRNKQPVLNISPVAPGTDVLVARDARVAQMDSQLRKVQSSIAELESEQSRQASIFEVLKRNAPENLPPNVVSDERYKKLKDAYEEAVASAAGAEDPKAAESSIAFAKKRIESWFNDVFVPESNVATEYRKEQIKQLQERAKVMEEQLARVREQEAKSSAAARR